jgi:sigma-B regulation protein RsbU (phosphoserine phosphatase)
MRHNQGQSPMFDLQSDAYQSSYMTTTAVQPGVPGTNPRERISGLTSVLDVTKSLAAERDLERLLELIIQQASVTLRCERASLFLHDEQNREMYTRKVTRLEGIQEIRLPADAGIVGLAARECRMVHIPDPYAHPLFNAEFDQRTGFRTRNILCAPLVSWGEGKLLGVLQLLNKRDGGFSDDDHQLLDAFAAHAAIAIDRAILARHYEEKMRLMVSLDVARKIQASLFPRVMPVVDGYELAAASRPADATGGDYYDAIPLKSGQVGLVMADVCGHGLGPSLLMASARAMLRGFTMCEPTPDRLLTDLGRALWNDLAPTHRFITFMYGALDPVEHCFRYANAGHGPVALHYRAATDSFHTLCEDEARGCPLGIIEEEYQSCAAVPLAPGDMLVLGTDGLIETRRDKQQFGLDRLCDFLRRHTHTPMRETIVELMDATSAFQSSGSPDDDLTLMLVRRDR